MPSSTQTPLTTLVPRSAKFAYDAHSDSGYDSGVEIKTKIHGQKPRAKKPAAKKLVSRCSWQLSDNFNWYSGPKDRADNSLEDPYDEFHHSGRSIPRAPNTTDERGHSLDRGCVESDFYIKGHSERRNPLADIYQIQADYEESIRWQPVENTKPVGAFKYKESEVVEEEDEVTTGGTDFIAFKKTKRRNKMKDLSRERNTGFETILK
jgi:hypothetical protein